jgi:hypothetical protein
MYDWAKFRRTKGAVKLHLVLDHDGYLPCFGIIIEGSVHDVKVAQQIHFAPGTIVVDDRGYNDYRLFAKWTEAGVFFVTRMKDNAQFEMVEEREPPQNRGILCDQTIELTGAGARERCPHRLRRIEPCARIPARRWCSSPTITAWTRAPLPPSTRTAGLWSFFFKGLKQNLKIKTFVGTTANAVKTQIWTALISMLLLRYLQLSSRFGWSLANLVALLRMNLFTHRDLMAWLDAPFATPPDPQPVPAQSTLAFA